MEAVATELPSAPKNRASIKELLTNALDNIKSSYIYESGFNIATISATVTDYELYSKVVSTLPERNSRQINDILFELEDYGIECLYNIVLGDLIAIGNKSGSKRHPTYHLISDGFIIEAHGITVLFRLTKI